MFYGTTVNGGASNDGTVFTVNPAGAERVLYGFTGVPDGAQPKATLLAYRDALYGTTSEAATQDASVVRRAAERHFASIPAATRPYCTGSEYVPTVRSRFRI